MVQPSKMIELGKTVLREEQENSDNYILAQHLIREVVEMINNPDYQSEDVDFLMEELFPINDEVVKDVSVARIHKQFDRAYKLKDSRAISAAQNDMYSTVEKYLKSQGKNAKRVDVIRYQLNLEGAVEISKV